MFRRLIVWCRRNPRVAAAIGVAVVVIAVIGQATGKDDGGPAAAAPSASSAPPSRTTTSSSATAVSVVPADRTGTTMPAGDLLATLSVKGRAAKTGYDRDEFGVAWTDDNASPLGRNGCDTRNDILARDLTGDVLKPGTRNCVLLAGSLRDPYTARTLTFTRGRASSAIQIDHVVALSNAWQTGAAAWSERARTAFANDPLNLLAVDGPTNSAKGDGDAATWLPPNKAYRCAYVARQVSVKHRYHLWVTAAERRAITSLLARCPGQRAPVEAAAPPVLTTPTPTSTPTPTPTRTRVAPRTTAEPVGCTTTSSGNCIRGGQFCPAASEGETGTDAAGRAYLCRDNGGRLRWTPA